MAQEIYYLIESISTATPLNDRYSGEVHVHIYGKGDFTLVRETPDGWKNCRLLSPYWVRQYGYKRECDAKRNYMYKNPEKTKWWDTEVNVIRAWVRKDNKVILEG